MVAIQLLRNLSLSSVRLAAVAPKRLPKGFNRPSALAMFMQKEFKNISAGIDGPQKVVFAAVTEKWNLLSAPEKEQYGKDAAKLGEERRQEFNNLPQSEQEQLLNEAKEQREKAAKRAKLQAKRNERQSKGYPKQPPNAFALFVKEQSSGKGRNVSETMVECAKTWSAMKAEDKAKYEEEAEKRKEEYSAAKAQIQKK